MDEHTPLIEENGGLDELHVVCMAYEFIMFAVIGCLTIMSIVIFAMTAEKGALIGIGSVWLVVIVANGALAIMIYVICRNWQLAVVAFVANILALPVSAVIPFIVLYIYCVSDESLSGLSDNRERIGVGSTTGA